MYWAPAHLKPQTPGSSLQAYRHGQAAIGNQTLAPAMKLGWSLHLFAQPRVHADRQCRARAQQGQVCRAEGLGFYEPLTGAYETQLSCARIPCGWQNYPTTQAPTREPCDVYFQTGFRRGRQAHTEAECVAHLHCGTEFCPLVKPKAAEQGPLLQFLQTEYAVSCGWQGQWSRSIRRARRLTQQDNNGRPQLGVRVPHQKPNVFPP